MRKLLDLFIQPFLVYKQVMVVLFILITLLDFYACLVYPNAIDRAYSVCVLSRGFMDSYLITLAYTLIPTKLLKSVYAVFMSILIVAFFLTDVVCVIGLHRRFDVEGAHVILGSNLQESVDFLMSYFSVGMMAFLLLFVIGMGLLYYGTKKLPLGNKFSYVLLISVCCSIAFNIYIPGPCFGNTLGKVSLFLNTPRVPNLKEYLTQPSVTVVNDQPQNIVVIIGESFSKPHSSLYGYDKNTNPLLSQLSKDSLLYVFNHVTSEGLHTIQAFQSFMSTYSHQSPSAKQWYECTTLPEVIHRSSYKSCWISNQSYKGFYDNVPTRYAELCDSMIFVGDKFSTSLKRDYDEEVLPPLSGLVQDSLNFFFVHLMGSHVFFEHRYPEKFNKFQESDYLAYSEHQRKTLATYDNSILYNDSVVSEVIKCFAQKESIVFYFSDHALDVYDSSDTYVGHGNANDPVSAKAGRDIPFMIYFSPLYKEKFPEQVDFFKHRINEDFSTSDLIYLMMKVMGVKVDGLKV